MTHFFLKSIGLILAYLIAAKISLTFATTAGGSTLLWIPGGIALAVVLTGGLRYLPSIFIGAYLASVMIHSPLVAGLSAAIGNTFETYIGYRLLTQSKNFDRSLAQPKNLFLLIVLGGLIAPVVSAVMGPAGLLMAGFVPANKFIDTVLTWWLGDALGITYFTPILLLLWQKETPKKNLASSAEKFALWVTSIIISAIVLLDLSPPIRLSVAPHGTAWIFILILWAGMRTGRKNTGLLQLLFISASFASAYLNIGLFSNDFAQYGLLNFWLFSTLLAVTGMMIAILSHENFISNQKISLSNLHLQTIIEAIPDAIFLKDSGGRWLIINQRAKDLFKLEGIPWQGKTDLELAEMQPKFRREYEKCIEDDEQAWKNRRLTIFDENIKDEGGRKLNYEVRKAPIFNSDNNRQSLVILSRDITEDIARKTALRESDLRWKFALKSSGHGIWEYNFNTGMSLVSSELMAILGYDDINETEQLTNWAERLHPDSRSERTEALKAIINNKTEQYEAIQQVLCKDGQYKWLFSRGVVISKSDDKNPVIMMGISTDITERQTAREQLRHIQEKHQKELEVSRDRYKDLYELAPVGYITVTHLGIITEVNLKASELLGLNRSILIQQPFDQFIDNEDQAYWQEYFSQMTNGRSKGIFNCDLKLKHSQHKTFYCNLNGVFIKNLHENPTLRIALTDISKQKNIEMSLRIAAIAFESQEGVFVTDANNTILRVNRSFTKITGYEAEAVIGQNPRILSAGKHDQAFYVDMWDKIKNDGQWAGEISNQHSNGEIYPAYLNITVVLDDKQQVSNYVATFTDITQAKNQEAQRVLDEKNLRDTLVREVHHRIKNNLQGVASLLHNSKTLNPDLNEPLTAAISRVHSIAVTHGIQGRKARSDIQLCDLINEIVNNINSLWQANITISLPVNMLQCNVRETEMVPLALVLNELISNAIKHSKHNTEIHIAVDAQQSPLNIQVCITNEGKLPANSDGTATPNIGTGLKLALSLLPKKGVQLAWQQSGIYVITKLTLENTIFIHEQQETQSS